VSDKLKQRVNEARKEVDAAKAEHGRLADEYAFAAQAHSAAVGGKQMGPQ
jgi:hypothetical protein